MAWWSTALLCMMKWGVLMFSLVQISSQAPFVSFPVAPQALITGNFQHFFIHVWSSLAPAKAMGGWGEVGLKVAFGGSVIHHFFAKGFGRKKTGWISVGRNLAIVCNHPQHWNRMFLFPFQDWERIGLYNSWHNPSIQLSLDSNHMAILETWRWSPSTFFCRPVGRGFGHCLPNLTHALVEDVYTDWHSQLGHVQPLFHFLEVPFLWCNL